MEPTQFLITLLLTGAVGSIIGVTVFLWCCASSSNVLTAAAEALAGRITAISVVSD